MQLIFIVYVYLKELNIIKWKILFFLFFFFLRENHAHQYAFIKLESL